MTDGRRPGWRTLASVLLAVSLLVPAVGTAGIATAQGGNTPVLPDPTAAFNQSTVEEDRGDVATIEVTLNDTSVANVTVGSPAKNYQTRVMVVDEDGDGRVRLRMNTYTAGRSEVEESVYEAVGNDTVASVNRTTRRLATPLEPSDYNLSVAAGGTRTGSATLDLQTRSTEELVTWTAPTAAFDNVTNASEVAAAVERGRITTTDTVAAGDVLVTQIEASGIYGALEAATLSELLAANVLDLRVRQTNPGTNRRPKAVNVSASLENDSIRVIPDPENDALYVNVDTGTAAVARGSIVPGDEYEVTFGVNQSSGLVTGTETLSANVSVVSPELGLGSVALAAAANQTVAGTASVAPGSRVRVEIANAENGSLLRATNTTLGSNGDFAAESNLSTIATNTTVAVRATGPFNTTDAVEVAVGSPPPTDEPADEPARLVFENQTTDGAAVTVANATLPEGGFVTVRRDGTTDGPPLGVSAYLDPGDHANIEVPLADPLAANATLTAVARTDDGNETDDATDAGADRPYTVGGENVTASARVSVTGGSTTTTTGTRTPGPSGTPEGGGTPETTGMPGSTATLEPAPGIDTTAAPPDGSGIDIDTLSAVIGGFVGVLAVVLLVVVAVLWRR